MTCIAGSNAVRSTCRASRRIEAAQRISTARARPVVRAVERFGAAWAGHVHGPPPSHGDSRFVRHAASAVRVPHPPLAGARPRGGGWGRRGLGATPDLPLLLLQPGRGRLPLAGRHPAERPTDVERRRPSRALPTLALGRAGRRAVHPVHPRLAARPPRSEADHRLRQLGPVLRCRPRGGRHLRVRLGDHATPRDRHRLGGHHGGLPDPGPPGRGPPELPVHARTGPAVRCGAPVRHPHGTHGARAAGGGAAGVDLLHPSLRRAPVGGGVRRLRDHRRATPLAAPHPSVPHRGRRSPPRGGGHAGLQPARHRRPAGLPDHRGRSPRHLRVRSAATDARLPDHRLHRGHGPVRRRQARLLPPLVPAGQLPRRRGRGRWGVGGAPSSEHPPDPPGGYRVPPRLPPLLGHEGVLGVHPPGRTHLLLADLRSGGGADGHRARPSPRAPPRRRARGSCWPSSWRRSRPRSAASR